jgi:tRNA-dihydrouridine synthase 3
MVKYGADITCGEMAVGTNLLEGKPSEWALLKRHPCESIFGVQIAAGFADQATRVCELLEAHASVDFVDLNMGCPLDLICNKGAGSSLMLRDTRLKQALQGMTTVMSCPITLKMRTGWNMNDPFCHKLVRKVQTWGMSDNIAAIFVHGRSRLQRYSNVADWDYISKVATSQDPDLKRFPIIGNGDILSYTDYEEKVGHEGIESCAMLARGALIKPWLATEIKEKRHWDISASERLDILKDFVRFGLEHWGSDQQGVNNTRRYLLEWLSFLHRYVPVGLLEVLPQQINHRPPPFMCGRNDLETLFMSDEASDWIKITEMLLGPVEEGFLFAPKHKSKGYQGSEG